jgi:hypothetical protein
MVTRTRFRNFIAYIKAYADHATAQVLIPTVFHMFLIGIIEGFWWTKWHLDNIFVSSLSSHFPSPPVNSFHQYSTFINSYNSQDNVLAKVYPGSQTISKAGGASNVTAKGQRPKCTSCTQMRAICSHYTERETWPRTAAKRRKSSSGKITLSLTGMKWLLL